MTGRRLPLAAVVFQLVYIGTVFVVNPRRLLGRTGWASPHRGPVIERVAGLVLVAGCASQLGAQVAAAVTGRTRSHGPTLAGAGGGLGLAALALAVAGQRALGEAWSTTAVTTETAPLVTDGVLSWVRNPVYTSVIVAMLAAGMICPTGMALPSLGVVVAGLEVQVRAVEEPILQQVHGEPYRTYRERTGRFLPRVRIRRPR